MLKCKGLCGRGVNEARHQRAMAVCRALSRSALCDLGALAKPLTPRAGRAYQPVFKIRQRRAAIVTAASSKLFEGARNVTTIELAEAEKLYTSLPDMSNSRHTMLIMFSPSCTYCKGMEAEVKQLASGLAGQSDIHFVALDTTSHATRYFAKNVLGVHALPAFCTFPKASRTFYKFKGGSRDAESLLKFLNMTCNQHGRTMWKLPGAPAEASREAGVSGSKAAVKKALSGTTTLDAAAASPIVGSLAAAPASPTSTPAVVAGLAAIAALIVGTVLATMRGVPPDGGGADSSSGLAPPAVASASSSGGGDGTGQAGERTLRELLADIDATINRTSSLFVRLVRARIGLVIAPIEDSPIAHERNSSSSGSSGSGTTSTAAAAAAAAPAASGPSSAPSRAAPPPALSSSAANAGRGPLGRGPSAGARVAAATVVPADFSLQERESGVTRELVHVSGLSAEQVLAMIKAEGGDVARAADRLLASGEISIDVTRTT